MSDLYKVVTRDLKSSRSICAVQYQVGQWTQPAIEGFSLFLCGSLEDARKMKFDYEKIFRVEAKDVTNVAPPQFLFASEIKLLEEVQ